MILGVGADLQQIAALQEAVARTGQAFLTRAFLPEELAECMKRVKPYEGLAARWAVKEALFKALGTGWCAEADWLTVLCDRAENGSPVLRFLGALSWLNEYSVHVSLSHSHGYAMGMVIIEEIASTERVVST